LKVAWTSGRGEEDQKSEGYADGAQGADLANQWQEARQIARHARLGGVGQCHSALLAKMKVTEELHLTHCVGFAEWDEMGKIGSPAVTEDAVATDVRLEVGVEDSCFAQPGRTCLKKTRSFPEGFGKISLRLKSP
jgi:hypothetical protein